MSDVMTDLKSAMTAVSTAKLKADNTATAASQAQAEYEAALSKVRGYREQMNKEIDEALASVGVGPSDPRVTSR